jgi:hypothetical protein
MSTRSTIALEFADGSVSQVYCHFDGYLDGVGDDLVRGYSDPFELQKIIDQGNMSCIGAPYTDRGESYEDNAPSRYQNVIEYFDECYREEYDYILRNVDGKATWFVRCYATGSEWVTIEEARKMEAEEFSE